MGKTFDFPAFHPIKNKRSLKKIHEGSSLKDPYKLENKIFTWCAHNWGTLFPANKNPPVKVYKLLAFRLKCAPYSLRATPFFKAAATAWSYDDLDIKSFFSFFFYIFLLIFLFFSFNSVQNLTSNHFKNCKSIKKIIFHN